MSDSPNGLPNDLDTPEKIRAMKDALYGQFQKERDGQAKLSLKVAHKALDIPYDDMEINVRNGFGVREMVVMAAIILGGFALLGWFVHDTRPAAQEQEFEVLFYDSAGRLIDVPRQPD